VLEALAHGVYSGLAWVRRRPFPAFLIAAFTFSWAEWLSLVASGARVGPGRLPTDLAGMTGPALAAFTVTAIAGGEAGLKEFALRIARIPWRSAWFWLLAPSPLLVALATLGVLSASGLPVPGAASFARYAGLPPLPLLAVFDLVLLCAGFGQEIGWRGMALPRLQARYGPLSGALLVAVPWGIWLLPLLAVNPARFSLDASPFARLAGSAMLVLASSVVLAFVVARTRGSVVAAAFWHASLRMATATDGGRGMVGAVVIAAVMGAAVVLVAAELVVRRRGDSLLVPVPGGFSARKAGDIPARKPI
jgi:membrane protease YdiL (CAAX protease family)